MAHELSCPRTMRTHYHVVQGWEGLYRGILALSSKLYKSKGSCCT